MQTTARKNELPLDKMTLMCEVTQLMAKEDINSPPTEGANIFGMFLEVWSFINLSYPHLTQACALLSNIFDIKR